MSGIVEFVESRVIDVHHILEEDTFWRFSRIVASFIVMESIDFGTCICDQYRSIDRLKMKSPEMFAKRIFVSSWYNVFSWRTGMAHTGKTTIMKIIIYTIYIFNFLVAKLPAVQVKSSSKTRTVQLTFESFDLNNSAISALHTPNVVRELLIKIACYRLFAIIYDLTTQWCNYKQFIIVYDIIVKMIVWVSSTDRIINFLLREKKTITGHIA